MQQRRKLEGSFTNYLMGNNATIPVVGEGATLLSYSDRYPAEVLEVSIDGKRCVIRQMKHKAKPNAGGMGHQDWELSPDPDAPTDTLVYRNGAWRREVTQIVFVESWYDSFSTNQERWDAMRELGILDEIRPIDGVTKVKKSYDKVNILFGQAEYHYDWEF
jgi:hypothetical protein